MLTSKERIKKIFNREKTSRVPVICPGGMMNMITKELMEVSGTYLPQAHTDPQLMAKLAAAVYEEEIFENIGVPFCMTVEAEAMGAKATLGSDIYEPHVVEYAFENILDWTKSKEINLGEGRAKVVLDAIKILKEKNYDAPIVGNISGPVSVASSVMEPNTYYKSLRRNKDEAHKFMDFVAKELLKFAKAEVEAGADFIVISDPSGTGEIMGPKMFNDYVIRYLNVVLDGLKAENIPTIVHICGQMRSVYDQLKYINADALSFDSIVSIKKVREFVGEEKLIMGNVSTYALEFSDQEGIRAATKSCIDSGTNILSPACGLGMKSPLSNLKAILESAKELGNEKN